MNKSILSVLSGCAIDNKLHTMWLLMIKDNLMIEHSLIIELSIVYFLIMLDPESLSLSLSLTN